MKIRKNSTFKVYNNKAVSCKLTLEIISSDSKSVMLIEKSAKTKVRKGDTFDEVTGKRIAESKALIKAYKTLKLTLESRSLMLMTKARIATDELLEVDQKLKHEIDHKYKLIKLEKD